MDVHTKKQRSYNMSRIRGRDTKPEIAVRRSLHKQGFRYRKHVKNLAGCPDIVMKRHNLAIFVHGCFWHSHDCEYGRKTVSNNAEFWKNKRHETVLRDRKNVNRLLESGWKVAEIWECEIKKHLKEKTLDDYIIIILNLDKKPSHKEPP
jgi:DNA mismatch endonuclease (patch repair protein)